MVSLARERIPCRRVIELEAGWTEFDSVGYRGSGRSPR